MSLFIRGFISKIESDIKLYKPVEYIESSGTAYIDTGINMTNKIRAVLDLQFVTDPTSSYSAVFGARADTNGWIYYSGTYDQYRLRHGGTANNSIAATPTDRVTIDMNQNTMTIGDQSVTATAATFSVGYTAYLGALNNEGAAQYASALKVYSAKIYDDDALVRDYIPAVDVYGRIGFWDKVSGAFFYNLGSGSYTAGPEV